MIPNKQGQLGDVLYLGQLSGAMWRTHHDHHYDINIFAGTAELPLRPTSDVFYPD